MKSISIIIPFLDEEKNLPILFERLRNTLRPLPYRFDFLFVNDGSRDGSEGLVRKWVGEFDNVRLLNLSRNFGHQTAVFAGLQHAQGDAVVILDSDLQDRPEAIPSFIETWERGAEVVYAIRQKRKEFFVKRMLFALFYRLFAKLSSIRIPLEAGLFCLMDRKVVSVLAAMPERNRYIPGLRAWTGFRQAGVPVERDFRGDGPPRVKVMRLFSLALDAIFSFSKAPLRLATAMGLITACLSFVATSVVLYKKLFTDEAIAGWTSTLLSIFIVGSVQLISIGIIGEYLARIYEEVKQRPAYVVSEIVGPSGNPPGDPAPPAESESRPGRREPARLEESGS